MSPSAPLVFNGISPRQFAQLAAKAAASGMAIAGNSGSASRLGVEVAWNYAPEAQQLTLQCLKTPFFVSAADVESRLRSLVEQTLSAL